MSELAPGNTLEETFVLEIIEKSFGGLENLDLDPMLDERTEKQQKSVDRARAQSHLILRRSLAELRSLQKNRTIPEQLQDQKAAGPRSSSVL